MSKKAILFLYEGQTEGEFYEEMLQQKVNARGIKLISKCMKGVYNLNKKVVGRINIFLEEDSNRDVNALYVFVACDREGPINQPAPFNDNLVRSEFKDDNRVKLIYPIIATQDLESWFFYEIENIYKFLKAPKNRRVVDKYKNIGSLNNRHLSQLFRQFGKTYQKGTRVENFLNNLDLNNIFEKSAELVKATEKLNKICKIPVSKK